MPPKENTGGGGGRGRGGGGRGRGGGGRGGQQRAVSGRGGGYRGGRNVSQPARGGATPPYGETPPVPPLPQTVQEPAPSAPSAPAAPSAPSAPPAQAPVQSPKLVDEIVDLPARPGYGALGQKVDIFTNHYRISNIPNMKIYQYALVIPSKDGDVAPKGMATAIWESKEVKAALGGYYSNLIFNGRAIAWGTDMIRNVPTIEVARGKQTLRVSFTYATEFSLSDLTAYINKQKGNSTEVLQCIMFLNQIIADTFTKSDRFMAVGRKYFPTRDDPNEISRPENMSLLEFRRGFYQAVHWGGTKGLTVNVNVTTGIFWNSDMHTIIDLALRSIGLTAGEGMLLSALNENQFRSISRNVRGVKFFIKYRGAGKEKQVHMATSLSKDTARGKRFEIDGKSLSVADYFQKTYNIRLQYPDAPLIKKGENLFPMEVCYMVPLQRFPQKLDGQAAANMIRFASKPPDVKKREIETKVRQLNYQADPTLKRFGMTIQPQMASVPARILPKPNLIGGSDMAGGAKFAPESGKWDLRGYRLKSCASLQRWGILVFDEQRKFGGAQGALARFIDTLCRTADDYGMRIDYNPVVTYGNFNAPQQSIHRDCDELYNRIQRTKGGLPEMLFFVIRGKSAIIYEHVKQYCDNVRGIQSQAMDGLNVIRKGGDRSYHANLLLKVNTKLGGTTVALETNFTDANNPTMFIGADVSHPAPGSKQPSLATMVGSIDHEGVRYACPLPLNQSNREESIQGVRSMVAELVTLYKKNTNTYPVRIMYLRDGVAEGQFAKVKELEVSAIKEAVERLSGRVPTVTAIVVRKRNHTRLFPRDREGDRGSRGNVHPGTVVDQDITHPRDFDFYLVPHSSIQGTARPAHYYVIHDENRCTADFIQKICYHMSYVYQRSSGAVSLHPAVYYAHLAGNRARVHDPSRDREDDSSSSTGGLSRSMGRMAIEASVPALRPLHANVQGSMWWM